MKQKNHIAVVLGVLLFAFVSIFPSKIATAQSTRVTDSVRSQLSDFWSAYGVDVVTQSRLLEKLDNGQSWDSLNGNKPSNSITTQSGSWQTTVDTYPDGSIVVAQVEQPQRVSGLRSISGCVYSGDHYSVIATGCTTTTNWGVYRLKWSFDFKSYQSVDATFSRYYGIEASVIAGQIGNKSFVKINDSDVRAYCDFNTVIGGGTIYTGVRLSGSSTISEYHN